MSSKLLTFDQIKKAIRALSKEPVVVRSRKNLFDNYDLSNPVNQRGLTTYDQSGYTIDRFILQQMSTEASLVVSDGCVKIVAKDNDGLLQRFDEGILIPGQEYTCSVLTKDGTLLTTSMEAPQPGSSNARIVEYPGSIWNFAMGFPVENSLVGYVWPVITYNQDSVKELDIQTLKLEDGDGQTLVYKDAQGKWSLIDPLPDKVLEFLKCQRYYEDNILFYGHVISSRFVQTVPFKVTKRSNTTCKIRSLDGTENAISYYFSGQWNDYILAGQSTFPSGTYGMDVVIENIPQTDVDIGFILSSNAEL